MYFCFKSFKGFEQPNLLIINFNRDHLLGKNLQRIQCRQKKCYQIFTSFRNFRVHLEKCHKSAQNVIEPVNVIKPLDKSCQEIISPNIQNNKLYVFP